MTNEIRAKVARLILGVSAKVPVIVVFGSDRGPTMGLALWVGKGKRRKMYPRHILVGDRWNVQ